MLTNELLLPGCQRKGNATNSGRPPSDNEAFHHSTAAAAGKFGHDHENAAHLLLLPQHCDFDIYSTSRLEQVNFALLYFFIIPPVDSFI